MGPASDRGVHFHDRATADLTEWTPNRYGADDLTDTPAGRIVMRNRPIYDVVALLARCGVGTVFLAHGWQKIQVGVTATGRNLDAMGVPLPSAAAVYSTFVELLGGAALILGIALPVAGTLLFLDMAGALIFVHAGHGVFLVDGGKVRNGFELVLVLGLAALVFAAGGGGRIALDQRLFGGRSRTAADEADEAPPPWRPAPGAAEETPLPSSTGRTIAAGAYPEPPGASEPAPRTAAEIVTDTSRDVIVAGRKKPEPSSDDTAPVRPRKKQPDPSSDDTTPVRTRGKQAGASGDDTAPTRTRKRQPRSSGS
jgi:putative oxidoreductase